MDYLTKSPQDLIIIIIHHLENKFKFMGIMLHALFYDNTEYEIINMF